MRCGFLYLMAIMDWATRKVLTWRLSSTMDAGFCVAALEETLARFGKPDIFNTDQGSQFPSQAFISVLRDAEVRISMHSRWRWMDQCLHRAPLAIPEVRVRLLPCLRDRFGAAGWPWPVDHLLQHPASALGPGRANPGGGLSADLMIKQAA
jgi:putative transposase